MLKQRNANDRLNVMPAKGGVKTEQSYKDSSAMLDYLIDGTALPEHLARSKAGQILPKFKNKADLAAEEARKFNATLAAEVAAKFDKSPLVAVGHIHACKCGAEWRTFGFYARRVTTTVHLEAEATFTKPLTYDPKPERPTDVIWNNVKEESCLKCFMGGSGSVVDSLNSVQGQ